MKIEKEDKMQISHRKFFRQDRNGSLWKILFDLIIENQLIIELIKVPAHKDNEGNNEVDKLSKSAYGNNTIIKFNTNNIENIHILPKWNNIVIDMRLRKFMTLVLLILNNL